MQLLKTATFKDIYEVDLFEKEFKSMTKEKFAFTPPYPRYQKWLISCLAVLDEYKMKAIQFPKFEQLSEVEPNLFSIRYPKAPLNPRVIYAFFDGDKVILLAAFKEKSKSDYKKNIALAHARLKQLNLTKGV